MLEARRSKDTPCPSHSEKGEPVQRSACAGVRLRKRGPVCERSPHQPQCAGGNGRLLFLQAEVVYHAAYGSAKDIAVYSALGLTKDQIFIVGKVSKKQYSQV